MFKLFLNWLFNTEARKTCAYLREFAKRHNAKVMYSPITQPNAIHFYIPIAGEEVIYSKQPHWGFPLYADELIENTPVYENTVYTLLQSYTPKFDNFKVTHVVKELHVVVLYEDKIINFVRYKI